MNDTFSNGFMEFTAIFFKLSLNEWYTICFRSPLKNWPHTNLTLLEIKECQQIVKLRCYIKKPFNSYSKDLPLYPTFWATVLWNRPSRAMVSTKYFQIHDICNFTFFRIHGCRKGNPFNYFLAELLIRILLQEWNFKSLCSVLRTVLCLWWVLPYRSL